MKKIIVQIISICVMVCFYSCTDESDAPGSTTSPLKMEINPDVVYFDKGKELIIDVQFEYVEYLEKLLISKKTSQEVSLYKSVPASDIEENSFSFFYSPLPGEDEFYLIFTAYDLNGRALKKTIYATNTKEFMLRNLTTIAKVTGNNLTGELFPNPNSTIAKYKLSATDLGIIWEIKPGKVGIFFGDSYGGDFVPGPAGGPNNGTDWRSNVLAFSENTDLNKGLIFSDMALDPYDSRRAREIIPRRMYKSFTSIPTSAICANGVQYVHYMDFQVFGGEEELRFSSLYKSDDEGKTWSSCQDKVRFGSYSKFGQVGYAKRDGYVYMVGTEIGRSTSARLARIKEESMLDYGSYEYWNGQRKAWMKGDENQATVILDGTVGELSVMFHEKYKRWIVLYFDSDKYAICYRTAAELNGSWSDEQVLASGFDYPQLYGSYMHPFANDGDQIYFTMSLWGPYNVYFMRADIVMPE